MAFRYHCMAVGILFGIFMCIPYSFGVAINKGAQSCTKSQSSQRTITIKNQITKEQLEVHCCGTHMPDTFSLSIHESVEQNKELFSYVHKHKKSHISEPMQVVVQDNRVTLHYSYSFARGIYQATKQVKFEVPADIHMLEISFSFDNDQRVLIPQARFVAPIESVS